MSRHKKAVFICIIFSLLLFCSLFFGFAGSRLLATDIDNSFSFSLENGFYTDDIQIALSVSSPRAKHMQIHYTLDGSTPTAASPLYTQPLTYQAEDDLKVITVRAVVCDSAQRVAGGPYTATYFVGKTAAVWTNTLVVSITADPEGLYSEENGILYPMTDCGPTAEDWKQFEKQNCKQRGDEWIRPAHMDIFEPDGSNVISQNIGLCIDGDHGSMTHYPYSLKVLAGTEYDSSHPDFSYDIFHYYNTRGTKFPHIQNFNNMVFRNGGNEYNAGVKDPQQRGTMLRWNVGSRLADEAGYMVAGARPAMIFLNGEFYCVAQLQDTYNRHNTASKTFLNKDQLQIYKDSERACTDNGGYEQLYYSYPDIQESPILLPENQEKLEQTVDIDAMFAYYAFELMINNTDFPKKNYAIWRYTGDPDDSMDTLYSDGKFRFLINDLDCIYDFRYDDDLWVAYFDNIKEDGTVMGSLIQIDEYKTRFLNALCDLMNSELFDWEHLDTVIGEANEDFSLIASYYYTREDEEQRQRNVALLKESAFARKAQVRDFIQDTFAPSRPYTLYVKEPQSGTSIHFSTTELIAADGDFQGTYYGDYPLTLSASCNNNRAFSHWNINGTRIDEPEVTLDASLIQNDRITVELVTTPAASAAGLLISEVYTGADGAWIELYNASEQDLDISAYALSNSIPVRHLKFGLPAVTLAPGEAYVVGVDNTGLFRLEQGIPVFLIKDDVAADYLTVPVMATSESYGRFGETNEWRYYVHPTKGESN